MALKVNYFLPSLQWAFNRAYILAALVTFISLFFYSYSYKLKPGAALIIFSFTTYTVALLIGTGSLFLLKYFILKHKS